MTEERGREREEKMSTISIDQVKEQHPLLFKD